MHLKTWLKARLGRQDKPKFPPPLAMAASPIPMPREAAASPSSANVAVNVQPREIHERLWTEAYDQARAGDQNIVNAYETILSTWLSEHSTRDERSQSPAVGISQQNEIAKGVVERRSQMQKLVELGLSRTEKHMTDIQRAGIGMQAALVLKEIVGKAVQASPEAAFAWVGVCFALEICMNPSTEASANRKGVTYVVSRMDWYWNLSGLLLDENSSEVCLQGSRRDLESAITQLYAKLLLYQMRSVCYFHRKRFATWMRDLIKLENWTGELSDIQAAERAVQRDSLQYNTIEIRNKLDSIAQSADLQGEKLDNLHSAIRKQTLQQETLHEMDADTRCIRDLRTTNPYDDKVRIEAFKGGLLKDSYRWVLDSTAFQQWHNNGCSELLWIKGDPGKGKTMLVCGIINELQKTIGSTAPISYFFCQATDDRINSATAVLRGLLYMLISHRPELIRHVRERYVQAGRSVFKDVNAWVALTEIFVDVLQDLSLGTTTYILIDGLDECFTDRLVLLQFIAKQSSAFAGVKWIVSSRNSPDIEEQLERAGHKLSLELNAKSVAAAVEQFTRQKVDQLAQAKAYKTELRSAVLETMRSKAGGTFLWVALACQSLEGTPRWNALKVIQDIPPGLDALYRRMLKQIKDAADANICRKILATTAVLYRPVTVSELVTLMEFPKAFDDDLDSVREIIGLCGSFLTLQDDIVRFVHQSANDFLLQRAAKDMFISGESKEEVNHLIFLRSLKAMQSTLYRNMYTLDTPGILVEEIRRPDPDPFRATRYSCDYWIDHLCDSDPSSSRHYRADLQEGGSLDTFLRTKYLYWLEALGLCESMSRGVLSMARLENLLNGSTYTLGVLDLVHDARRFMMSHKVAIAAAPLQTYISALVFSPKNSLTRELFQEEAPSWLTIRPAMRDDWSACLQTLEGHTRWVWSTCFSHDSAWLASASDDSTIRIWDARSGDCLRTLEGHSEPVRSVTFSHDSAWLASASDDSTIRIWDARSGDCLRTLEGHSEPVRSVTFSHDSAWLASASDDSTIRIWDARSGDCLRTLEGHSEPVRSVTFSHDSAWLASASDDSTIRIWDARSGDCLRTLEGHREPVRSVTFSHDSAWLASASDDSTIRIWDARSGDCLRTLEGHREPVRSVTFSHDSAWLASASDDSTIRIWNASNIECLKVLEGHGYGVNIAVFSHDSSLIASASDDKTVKIWDAIFDSKSQILDRHSGWVNYVAFSHDKNLLASAADDGLVKIWDAVSGNCLRTIKAHSGWARSLAFSHDSAWIASAGDDKLVKIWDVDSGNCLQPFEAQRDCSGPTIAFSHDSAWLASASDDSTIRIWDAQSGNCLQTLKGHSEAVRSVAFSHDSAWLASASDDSTIKIWDTSNSNLLQTLRGHSASVESAAFLHDSTQLVSASIDGKVKFWESSSASCLLTRNIGISLEAMPETIVWAYLRNEVRNIVISTSIIENDETAMIKVSGFQYGNAGLNVDENWISLNSERLVRVPPEYLPSFSTTSGKTIGIGVASGRVLTCKIEPPESQ